MKLDPHLLLVNKKYHFDPKMLEMFEMQDVVDSDGPTYIEKDTYKAYIDLYAYLEETYGISLNFVSAGRSIDRQKQVMEEMIRLKGVEEAIKTTAKPGESEHHIGLAIDAVPTSAKLQEVSRKVSVLPSKLANLAIRPIKDDLYAKMHESLEQFGFVVRFKADKEEKTGYPAERWHIRYVGKEHAKAMNEGNMCLEEYLTFLKENQAAYE